MVLREILCWKFPIKLLMKKNMTLMQHTRGFSATLFACVRAHFFTHTHKETTSTCDWLLFLFPAHAFNEKLSAINTHAMFITAHWLEIMKGNEEATNRE